MWIYKKIIDLNFIFLNSVMHFLIHESMHHNILYKKYLRNNYDFKRLLNIIEYLLNLS